MLSPLVFRGTSMMKPLLPILLVISLGIPAISQTTQLSCSGKNGFGAQFHTVSTTGVDTPYTLLATIKTESKLPDGTTRSGSTTSRQVRDSQGRTRVENPSLCALDKDQQPHWVGSITVTDPIANTYTSWQQNFPSSAHTVSVTHMLSGLRMPKPLTGQDEYALEKRMSQSSDSKLESRQVEDLGTRNIVGLQASGFRVTRSRTSVIAGNPILLTNVEEKWISDQYRMVLLDIQDDPIGGKSSYEVTEFNQDEPDASLFKSPAGYESDDRTMTQ